MHEKDWGGRDRSKRGVTWQQEALGEGTAAMATEPQLMSDNVADSCSVGVNCLCVCVREREGDCVCVCVCAEGKHTWEAKAQAKKGCKATPQQGHASLALCLSLLYPPSLSLSSLFLPLSLPQSPPSL